MRANRLLAMVLLLQNRGRMTATALARELQVSVRTIYRDATALHDAGIPLYADSGPDGGYQLVDGYRTRLTGMTAGEAEALFLTGLPGPAAELGLASEVAAAQLKVDAALPDPLRHRSQRMRERFHLDPASWYHDGDACPFLVDAAEAVWQSRRIRVTYQSWTGLAERTLDPYGLVLKAGRWFLVAAIPSATPTATPTATPAPAAAPTASSTSGDVAIRTYRVNQIQALALIGETFDRPAGFDLPSHWQAQVRDFRSRMWQGQALVRLSPAGMERITDLMSQTVVAAARRGRLDSDGWRRAWLPIESTTSATTDLLRLGADVEVLEPAELRERLASTAAGMAALYAGNPADLPGP